LSANFRGKAGGCRPPTNVGVKKTRLPGLSRGVVCVILRLSVLIQYRRETHRQTDRQTDRRTDDDGYYPRLAMAPRG